MLAAAIVAGNASAAARPIFTGIEVPPNSVSAHLTTQFDRAKDILSYNSTQTTGVRYVRIVVQWSGIAPTLPKNPADPTDSAYQWAALDQRINLAVAHGLTPFVTVHKAPTWAEDLSVTGQQGTRNPSAAAFHLFAIAIATRYPVVTHWEAWNEPNLRYFLNPQKTPSGAWASPAIYRNLLNAFSTGIHSVNPNAIVVGGATAPFGNKQQPGPLLFMRRVLCLSDTDHPVSGCAGNYARADAWSTHPYTQGNATHHAASPTSVSLGDLPEMKHTLNAAWNASPRHIATSRSHVELWVGEFSWDSNLPDPDAVPTALHARWVSEAVYRAWRAGVSTFIWFTVRDRSVLPAPVGAVYQAGFWYCGHASKADDDSCDSSSYSYANDVRKLSWRAYWFPFVAYASSGRLTVWGRTPGAQPNVRVVIERKAATRWIRITTLTSNGAGIFSKVMSSSLTRRSVRARIGTSKKSLGFSLVRPRDRFVIPFGCGGTTPC